MEDYQNPAYYNRLIDQAGSYHELVILRSRYFPLMEKNLSKDDCLVVKDYWHTKAKDENLPVAPAQVQAKD